MCGFAGLVRWDGLAPEDPGRLRSAARLLAHRGPDSEGHFSDFRCALAFRRLKVLDLTPAGEQPMANEDGSLHLVFNGEIYNFGDLRSQLEARGHLFRSRCDAEVLLHGYETWGAELLPRLRGMFAFALWDGPRGKLFLARDPLGVKPLYFAERRERLLFASEPKALFATGWVEPEPDGVAILEALTLRYVPAPRSGFRDVEKLPPGHLAEAEKGRLTYRRWWELPPPAAGPEPPKGGASSFASKPPLEDALRAATHRRLVSDAPLGAWLSGGIDSALVVSFMRERGPVRTFAAGFDQDEYDERPSARRTAEHLGAEHTEFAAPPDLFNRLEQVVWHADEPFFDSSCLPTYALARETKRHVTVALSGDGGDELFSGYLRYLGLRRLAAWKRLPAPVRSLALAAAKVLRGRAHSRSGWDRGLRWLQNCLETERTGRHPYLAAMSLFDQKDITSLFGERLAESGAEADGRETLAQSLLRNSRLYYPDNPPGLHRTDPGILQRTDLETYLPGDVLHKVDRMAMAHGLEVRSPFLDVDLAETAFGLPDEVRAAGGRTKPLLRRLAEGRLPKETARAAKRGFGVPLDDWFRGALSAVAREVFEASGLVKAGLLKAKYWERLWSEHQGRRAQHGERLYALLALEQWHAQFFQRRRFLEPPGAAK
jgi:asparagine synthase (glutamine-hydrolysing)